MSLEIAYLIMSFAAFGAFAVTLAYAITCTESLRRPARQGTVKHSGEGASAGAPRGVTAHS